MNFKIEVWEVRTIIRLYDEGKINLNPPYQRNPVWTKSAQADLIRTIAEGAPIPNFFLFDRNGDGSLEMVDGQQRTRSILSFAKTDEIRLNGVSDEYKTSTFLSYQIAVIIISDVDVPGFIEEFYFRVNSTGMKLNRPEGFKARYLTTRFMEVVMNITNSDEFQRLSLFVPSTEKRMMDRDLVEELCALIVHGITDKKLQVDKMYDSDIDDSELEMIISKSKHILSVLLELNDIKPIKLTRYKQRNDFYTLFGFIKDNLDIDLEIFKVFYSILIILDPVIRPSKFTSKVLAEYAFNCITQSNSSKARLNRLQILNNIFLNIESEPNEAQVEIQQYFQIQNGCFQIFDKYLTFNPQQLELAISRFVNQEKEKS